MRKIMTIGMLVLSLGVAGGCGDSVENNMQRAEIAVNRAKFDHALDLADKVLEVEPDNVQAARIKARSLLQLGRLDAAGKVIEALLVKHPQDVELHQMLVRWGVLHNLQLVENSALIRVTDGRIAIDADMMSQIDNTRQVVETQAQWLANEGNKPAEAEYARAELADLRSRLYERHRELLKNTLARTDEDRNNRGPQIQQLETDIDRSRADMQARLASTLASDAEHKGAALRYNSVLLSRKQWKELWSFLEKSSEQKDLHEALVSQMVLSLLEIPSTVHPIAERLELGWKLTESVPVARRQSIDWWLTNARLHMMAGQYAKATPLLEQVRSKAPQNNDASYLLASCFYHQNQFKQANAILKNLSVKLNRSANVALLHGMTLRELGDNGAREALRHAIDLAPDNALAREQMILLQNQSGESAAAQDDLQKLYDKDPSNPRAIRFMLQFLRAQGENDKVAQLLRQVEQIMPRRDEYMSSLVDGYVFLRQYKQAEETALEWVTRAGDKLEPNMVLIRLLLMQDKEVEARALITRMQAKFPQEQDLDELVGTLYLQQRSYDKAIEYFDKVLAKSDANTNARLKLAQAQFNLVLADEALENVKKILEEDPTHTEALSLASRIYQSQGNQQLATETLARIDTKKVDVRTNPLLAAQIKARAEQYEEAINIANQAIFAGNDDPALRLLVAAINVRQGNLAEAENQLVSLVRSQPDNWLAYSALGTFYAQNKMTEKGVSVLMGLSGSNQLYTRLALAGLLARSGSHARAMEQVEGLLKPMIQRRDARSITVASVIASLHIALKDPAKAVATYQQLIDAKLNVPAATLAQIDISLTSWKKGDDATAPTKRLEALLTILTPEDRAVAFQIVRRLSVLQQYDSALKIVDGWLAQTPDNTSMQVIKGGLLLEAGRNVEAADVYLQATKVAPENAQLWLRLAQAYSRGYQFPQAENAYRMLGKLGTGARAASLTELGQLYAALGLNQQATEVFEELDREGNLRDPRIIYAMGIAAKAIGKDDIAMNRFNQVPESSTLYSSAQIKITQIDQAHGRTDDARKRLSDLARNPATAVAAVQELANMSMRNKNEEQILRWSDQMLRMDSLPTSQRLVWLNLRAELAMSHRDWTGASQTLAQLYVLSAENPQIGARRILVALQTNKPDEARAIYRENKVLQQSPLGESLAALLGVESDAAAAKLPPLVQYYVAMRLGDVEMAKATVSSMPPQPMLYRSDMLAATQRPDISTPEFKGAMGSLFAAELAQAVGMNELAAQLSENVLTRYYGLGLAQSVSAKTAAAVQNTPRQMWVKMAQQVPGTAAAELANSQVNVLDQKYDAAAENVRKLYAMEPDNVFVEYRLAGILIQAKKNDEAIKLLEQIVTKNDRFGVVASNDLAYMLAVHRPERLDEARKMADKARAALPNNPALLDTIGWINHLGNDNKAAQPLLVRASSAMRTSAEVHHHLGVVYAANGNKDWGRYHLQAAKSLPEAKDIKGLNEALKQLD